MNHFRFPLCLLAFTLLLTSATNSAKAQVDIPETVDFSLLTTGTIVCEGFESLVDFNGDLAQDGTLPIDSDFSQVLIPSPQTTALGQLSSVGTGLRSILADIGRFTGVDGETVFAVSDTGFGTFILDLDPELGKLEAFRITFVESAFEVSFFDGDTLIDTFSIIDVSDEFTSNDGVQGSLDWFNTDMSNVTRIEIASDSASVSPAAVGSISLTNLKASFFTESEPVLPAEVIIPMLIEDVEELIESNDIGNGEGNPIRNFLNQALKDISKGKIGKAIDKLDDASERVLELIENGSLSAEEGQAILDMIDAAILDLLAP